MKTATSRDLLLALAGALAGAGLLGLVERVLDARGSESRLVELPLSPEHQGTPDALDTAPPNEPGTEPQRNALAAPLEPTRDGVEVYRVRSELSPQELEDLQIRARLLELEVQRHERTIDELRRLIAQLSVPPDSATAHFLDSADAKEMDPVDVTYVRDVLDRMPVFLAPGEPQLLAEIEGRYAPQLRLWSSYKTATRLGNDWPGEIPERPSAVARNDELLGVLGKERVLREVGEAELRKLLGDYQFEASFTP